MFWERFVQLCAERNTKPNPVAKELGISSGAVTNWKNGAVPQSATLKRIADYFGVSVSYLQGLSDEPSVVLSDQVIANLSANVQRVVDELDKQKKPVPGLNPKLSSMLDQMNAEELEDLERYAEFILSKKKGGKS
jgi:transcriptional regulator with XRE-family HTH domain